MDKEAFIRGYARGMEDLGVVKDASKSADNLINAVKFPLIAGAGVGTLGGILASYVNSYATTPNDADLEILENKALIQEAKRQTRALKTLRDDAATLGGANQRPMRTGL
jgi:hypothetical protein